VGKRYSRLGAPAPGRLAFPELASRLCPGNGTAAPGPQGRTQGDSAGAAGRLRGEPTMWGTGRWLGLLVGTGLIMGSAGVSRRGATQPQWPEVKPGVVFVVDGVGGFDVMGKAAQGALPRAGVRHEIRVFIWTHGWGQLLKDLQDTRHLLHKAD